jgi:hypothetical protein
MLALRSHQCHEELVQYYIRYYIIDHGFRPGGTLRAACGQLTRHHAQTATGAIGTEQVTQTTEQVTQTTVQVTQTTAQVIQTDGTA